MPGGWGRQGVAQNDNYFLIVIDSEQALRHQGGPQHPVAGVL